MKSAAACPAQAVRTNRGQPLLVGWATVIVAIAAVVPSLRLPLLLTASGGVALLFAWRTRALRLRPAPMWLLFAAVLACLAAAGTIRAVTGHDTAAALTLNYAAHLSALPRLVLLLRSTVTSIRQSEGRWLECLLLFMAGATVSVQVASMHAHGFGNWRHWLMLGPTPPIDVLFVVMLVRLLITRSYLPRAYRLLLWGAAGLLLFDLSSGAGGPRVPTGSSADLVVGLVGVGLLGIALLDPTVRFFLGSVEQYPAPAGSLRMLSVGPPVLAAPAVWILGQLGVLPQTSATLLAGVEVAIVSCALLLAVRSLHTVEELAERDVTTGLINRRGLPRATRKLLATRGPNARAALAVIDLDGFKQVNDRYGHDVGDALLRAVAHRLRQTVGRHGVACRIGGDEFVVVYVEENADARPAVHTRSLTQRISAALQEPCDLGGGLKLQAGASIGATPLNRASDLVQVMVNSDAAMYAAKNAARLTGASRSATLATDRAAHPGPDAHDIRDDSVESAAS